MGSLLVGFEVIIPLTILMGIGYFLRRINLIDERAIKTVNSIVFKLFLPILIFYKIYVTDLSSGFNYNLLVFSLTTTVLSFILIFIVIYFIEKENAKRGVLIQAIFRSNSVIFGIPVITSLFGESLLGIPSIIIASTIPIYNSLSVITLEIFKGGKINPVKIIKGIITNPLIIASTIGLLFLFINVEFPVFIEKTIDDIASVATPLSLIALGSSFVFKNIKINLSQNIIGVVGRLIVIPAIFIPLAILFGYKEVELITIVILFAAPTAVSSYTMAQQMGGDSDLAGSLVVLQSIFSILTIFAITSILSYLGFITAI